MECLGLSIIPSKSPTLLRGANLVTSVIEIFMLMLHTSSTSYVGIATK